MHNQTPHESLLQQEGLILKVDSGRGLIAVGPLPGSRCPRTHLDDVIASRGRTGVDSAPSRLCPQPCADDNTPLTPIAPGPASST